MKVPVPVPCPNSLYGLRGRDATLEERKVRARAPELCESGGGRPDLPVPNSPYGLCGRKATLNYTTTKSSGKALRW